MRKRQERKKNTHPTLTSALKIIDVKPQLLALGANAIGELAHDLSTYLYWWMGDPTEELLKEIRDTVPIAAQFIDFDTVCRRLSDLDAFERDNFGVELDVFFPELRQLHRAVVEVMCELPKGIPKAESWLRPIARQCGADADVEAAVYFASRGQGAMVDVESLRNAWHSAICIDIERGQPVGKVPQSVGDRARSRTLSLAEASRVLTYNQWLPRFFSFRDEEEDFIDAAMFRAAEWFGITGFEPWLKSLIRDLSDGPVNGIDHIPAAWWLFYWCRSDLALRMADRQGLEMWLWALSNGPIDRKEPWRTFWAVGDGPLYRDYVPIASIILFVWHRIQPANLKTDILTTASSLLFQTQLRSGAWPLYSDDSEPSLIATCFAIHGLASSKPTGWNAAVTLAAAWLTDQQGDLGAWTISGGPAVMLTVLALDSLAIARGESGVTFGAGRTIGVSDAPARIAMPLPQVHTEPTYNYENQHWFKTNLPAMKSLAVDEAKRITKPRLSIVVATETELRYTLNALAPLPKRRSVLRITKEYDTVYLGVFGAFETVVVLSSMGSEGITGSTLSVDALIREWDPQAVAMLGIAFGASRAKHKPADVLVAEHLIPYERQRRGDQPAFRNPVPPSSAALVNRFRHALDWSFHRPDGSQCSKHVGPLLSGEKLIDSSNFKESLLEQYPNAIGGEMEGTGLWSAAARARKDWIIVKGVCDWADGQKHDNYQPMAAAAAVSLCKNAFSDPHALDGL